MKKRIALTALVSMLAGFSFSMTAFGNSLLQEVNAILNKEVKLVLNGGPWEMQIGGQTYYPLTYEGRTYLPVSAVAQALSVPISYDSASNTVYIGERTTKVPILSEDYRATSPQIVNDASQRLINGEDHGAVALFSKVIYSNSTMLLLPETKYSELVLYVDVDGADVDLSLLNMNDGNRPVVLHSESVTESDGLKEITVDITGIRALSVNVITAEPNQTAVVRIAAEKSFYK